jgi:hypothetical protein
MSKGKLLWPVGAAPPANGSVPGAAPAASGGVGVTGAGTGGDDPLSGAKNASRNLIDLWAQTGMSPKEVLDSHDPLLIDALTKEQPGGLNRGGLWAT